MEKHQDQMLTLRSTPVLGKGTDRREAGLTTQLLSSWLSLCVFPCNSSGHGQGIGVLCFPHEL